MNAEELLTFAARRISGRYEVDEFGYDAELNDKVILELLRPLYRHWFRVETIGLHNLPPDGALVVANHSGTLPVDALMLQVALHDEAGRAVRLLGADLVHRLPLLGHLSRKTGHTLACKEDADRLLRKGELVGVFPEGFKGIGKPWSQRYKLQRFGRGGFVASAIRAGVPIVPCSIVGAEEIYPKIGELRLPARLLGLPYLPITPLFPWFGPLGLVPLPSKWLIEFGEPIRSDEVDPAEADDPMVVFELTDQVRETIQRSLNALRLRRGPAFFL
ncbi:lysophospholipid acyltransferase family protein [Herbidospora yilanensis]|uniref:lysophospholipid acyltransferase family protein n=1 Tax=Herbidospora yilanensis TaxID=354426 RepID=UPI000A492525|nr:lysophospholipid acyltransferase family protein [Herbidospora yilanensis]